jgi:mono/diheme cytochrome c family protein
MAELTGKNVKVCRDFGTARRPAAFYDNGMSRQPDSSWRRRWTASLAAVALCGGPGVAAVAVEPPEHLFRDRVAPLLAAKCGACHGPEGAESGFRIDDRDKAAGGGDSGSAGIVPGKPAESELFVRVSTNDKESRMPADGDPLTGDEQALIKDWIVAGAVWPDAMQSLAELLPQGEPKPVKGQNHWAFQPLARPPVPPAPHGTAPVDAFLEEQLAAAGLAMNLEADPRTLIRRVAFDLVGLPPSPEEIAAFEDACRAAGGVEGPYGDLVDRLLASPHYGERWARHWLDVVRFAESHGFEMNKVRPNAWPYRDWVIESLNADKPYDQFVREQLAGDQVGIDAAMGFLVGGPKDEVRSPDPVLTANQRADELHDMVSTTASAFFGLTVGCARCHDHKFDPIPQTDYYAMKAVFEGVQHGDRDIPPPDDDERMKKVAAVEAELAPLQRRIAELQPAARLLRTIVIDDRTTGHTEKLVEPRGIADHAGGTERGHAAEPGDIRSLPNLGRQYHWWTAQPGEAVFAYAPRAAGSFRIWLSWGAGWHSHARDARYVLDADGDPATTADQQDIAVVDQRLVADGSGDPPPNQALWSGFRDAGAHELTAATRLLVVGGASPAPVTADVVIFEEQESAADSGGLVAHLRGRVTAGANVDAFPPVPAKFVRFTVRATSSAEPCIDELEVLTPSGRNVARGAKPSSSGDYDKSNFHKLAHVNDGLYGNRKSWISNQIGGGWVQLELPEVEEVSRVVWSRDRSPKPQYSDRLATEYEIAVSLDGQAWTTVATHADRLPADYVHADVIGPIRAAAGLSPNELAELESLEENVAGLTKKLAALTTLPKAYAGQFVTPAKTHRFYRGDPMEPREEIQPGSPTNFGSAWQLPTDAPEPERRRALAEWIVAPSNPLTPRVIVNRLWHHHFGTGIVDTPSDFGVNGGAPTHPTLLDWLASELVDPANPTDRWRLKRIHRLIVTSRAYRQASTARPDGLTVDSNARLLWRYPPRRLEAEPLRDAILAVSGSLNPTMGGPGFDLFEPNTNYVKVYTTKTTFTDDDFRRMVYQAKPRAELDSFFGAFDCPDAGQVQPARTVSTTPLQALNMMNGEFLLDQAGRFAARVEREAGSEPGLQVARAFAVAFGREPSAAELAAGRDLVITHGLPILCRSLYNASEFITVY